MAANAGRLHGLHGMGQRVRGGGAQAAGAGGAPVAGAHKGQSMLVEPISTAPSSVCTIHLMAPAPEQITSMDCGWMSGDATDTPMEATNRQHPKAQEGEGSTTGHGARLCPVPVVHRLDLTGVVSAPVLRALQPLACARPTALR